MQLHILTTWKFTSVETGDVQTKTSQVHTQVRDFCRRIEGVGQLGDAGVKPTYTTTYQQKRYVH
jgi:hypothetical protein